MKIRKLVLVVLLISSGLFSQTPKQIDSLEQLLGKTTNDSLRIALQKRLYMGYYDSLPKKASEITRNMISESTKSGYEEGIAAGHYLRGHLYVTSANYDSADYHLRKSLDIGLRTNLPNISLNALEWIANVHQKRGNMDSSLFYVQKAFKIANENSGIPGDKISRIKLNEARIYQSEGKHEEAIDTYLEAEKLLPDEQIGLKGTIIARIGGMYYYLERDEKAKEYFLQAQTIFQETSDKNAYFSMENKLGNIEMAANNLVAAEQHYLKAYTHFESVDGFIDMATIGSNLGYIYLQQQKYELSAEYFEASIALSEKYEQISLLPYSYNGLGELYRKTNNLDKAIVSYKKAIDLAKKKGVTGYLLDSYTFLIEAYRDKNDFKNAFNHQAYLMQMKDSLDEKSSLAKISDIEAKYQNEKKEQEIKLLTSETQLAAQRTKNQRNLFIGGISLLGLAVISLFVLFRNKQKTNTRLRQLEAAKSKFFANISHEFRTPLTLISGPVAHQLSKPKLATGDKVDLGLIQRNANRLLSLVDQLLDLSKIEAGRRQLKLSKGALDLYIKHLLESFRYQAENKGTPFHSTVHIDQEAWFDRDVIEKIVTNLVSNALKYSPKNGKIDFSAALNSNKSHVEIKVTNNNVDIPEKELPTLFDRFYQDKSINEGFGIGLSLVKELTHLSKGKVKAHKPTPETIQFVVTLPIVASAFEKEDFALTEDVQNMGTRAFASQAQVLEEGKTGLDESLPLLLVVDDNEEIRLFIKSLLKRHYRILEAENGDEGVQKALEVVPDLVISDVMMPVKDGIYLSNQLKKDERTSHIPIVLLTAKSGEDNELTGLKTGADAYMTKPFKEEKLKVVIEKLIASRATIQEKFSQQVILKPREIKLTPVDAKLLGRIQNILDEQLTNPDFGAEAFSNQVGLSRMHLHRKLKALTGLTTSEFIRTQRLKLAAKLLKDGDANISEIGYTVGFNQPAYFSTAFKQHFGCSPSEFV